MTKALNPKNDQILGIVDMATDLLARAIRRVNVPAFQAGGNGWWGSVDYLRRMDRKYAMRPQILRLAAEQNAEDRILGILDAARVESPFTAVRIPGKVAQNG